MSDDPLEIANLEARLQQLTPRQREHLASKLKNIQGNAPSARKQVVAYIVSTNDSSGVSTTAADFDGGELRRSMRQQLPEYMVPAHFVVLDALPRTPNGKVDRKRLPAPTPPLQRAVDEDTAPRSTTEETLATIWAQALGTEHVGLHENFFELGGDSILSIQIIAKANQQGMRLTPSQLFQHQTVAELAAVARTDQPTEIAEQGLVVGDVPLTPIQQWFFEQELPNRHHWNQAFLFEVPYYVDAARLEEVLAEILNHHDALRLTFSEKDLAEGESGWMQSHSSTVITPTVDVVDLGGLSDEAQAQIIEQHSTAFQGTLTLSDAPLMGCMLFRRGLNQTQRLLIVVHHLVIDGVSWRILLEDFETAYRQLLRGETRQFPAKTRSFQAWAKTLGEHAQSEAVQSELDYWLSQVDCGATEEASALPLDHATASENSKKSEQRVIVTLSQDETQALISDVPAAYNTQINDILLTALTQTITQWSSAEALLIELEGHGREDIADGIDLSRTVGWFTATYPVQLWATAADSSSGKSQEYVLGAAIKSIKEQLRRIPNRGIGYGLLRYLSNDREIRQQLASAQRPPILFNYLGQLDQTVAESQFFRFAKEPIGPFQSPAGHRPHIFEINTLVIKQQLRIEWKYSQSLHTSTTVEGLAKRFVENLTTIIEHCVAPNSGGYTPSDFGEVALDQGEIDALAAEFG